LLLPRALEQALAISLKIEADGLGDRGVRHEPRALLARPGVAGGLGGAGGVRPDAARAGEQRLQEPTLTVGHGAPPPDTESVGQDRAGPPETFTWRRARLICSAGTASLRTVASVRRADR